MSDALRSAGRRDVIVSMSWPFDGIQRMARGLDRAGRLESFCVLHDASRAHALATRTLGAQSRVTRLLAKRAFTPRGRSMAVARSLAWAVAIRTGHGKRIRTGSVLDELVARRVRERRTGFVGINGSAYRSLLAARDAARPGLLMVITNVWTGGTALVAELANATPAEEDLIRREMPGLPAVESVEREMRAASAILCESEQMRRAIRGAGIDEARIIKLHCAVDTTRFPAVTRDTANRPLRALFVGGVGGSWFRKGARYAAAGARDAGAAVESLSMAGRRGSSGPTLRAALPNANLLGEVHVLDIPGLMAKADVLILPSLSESMARVVLEGMSSALPVITTAESGYEDVIVDGENGFLVPVRDSAAIAERLSLLAREGELRERIGRAARATAERFTWDQFEDRFLDRCLPLLDAPPVPPLAPGPT